MRRIILLVLCVCLSVSAAFAQEPTPTVSKETLMVRCVFSGGTWKDGECVKGIPAPTGQPTPTATPNATAQPPACNPLLCMIQHRGKCIDGVCVENSLGTKPVPPLSEYPKH